MTRIDFYLLPGIDDDKEQLACRLAEKAFRLGHEIFILAGDASAARRLDESLWVFSPNSFVPHRLHDAGDAPAPVLIGHDEPPPQVHDVLISLKPEVPDCFSRFQRLIELVGAGEDDRARSRERFRFYRDRGYPLQTHNL